MTAPPIGTQTAQTASLERDQLTSQVTVTARTADGHLHIVNGDDVYSAVCKAAETTGINLADG